MYGGSFAESTAGMYAFSGVAGGLGFVFTGGNFWQGAVTGLMVAGLNHLNHKTVTFFGKGERTKAYTEMWETSLEKVVEISAWEITTGEIIVLPYDKNTYGSAFNDFLPFSKDGKSVIYNGKPYKIQTHTHTHPIVKGGLRVSPEDIFLMNSLGLKYINIIQSKQVYQVTPTSINPWWRW